MDRESRRISVPWFFDPSNVRAMSLQAAESVWDWLSPTASPNPSEDFSRSRTLLVEGARWY
jgi:hypothetical protein